MPPRLLAAAALRLRRHAREVPDVLVVQLGRVQQDLEPVRGDAERALLLGAVVRVRARAAAQAHRGARCSRRSYPVVTLVVIVITANHYFLDAVGGFAIFGIGYVVARAGSRRAGRAPEPSSRAGPSQPAPLVTDRYDLDHVALAAADTRAALRFLTGDARRHRSSSAAQAIGFRPMQVWLGDRDGDGMPVELLEPWDVEQNDFLARFVARHGAGPHHLTFKVPRPRRRARTVSAARASIR